MHATRPEAPALAASVSHEGSRVWRRLRRDRSAMAGLIIVSVLVVVAVAAPLVATHDPIDGDTSQSLQGPGRTHILGTDDLGRDMFSRLVFGSRLSLGTAVLAAVVMVTIGLSVGLLAGLRGGWVDAVCMRVVDALLAFPSMVLVLAIAGTFRGGLVIIVVGLAAVSWAPYARLVRGLALQLRDRPFVEAARSLGASGPLVAYRHVVPHVLGPVVVLLTVEMGSLVVAVSALSFLGVGAHPPSPEWGAMLNEGRSWLPVDARLVVLPGAAVTLAALGFNLVGEGIRDIADPLGEVAAARALRPRRRPAVQRT